jgi:2-polyprenyl-6-methoxyphenol hydroxylase-like FAD-dependent oxidoreductase
LFGDVITAISDDGDVTFARNGSRTFDVIVGADGLHSGVRQLVFGPDAGHNEFLGAYLSVVSVPKSLARYGEAAVFVDVDRFAMIYTADHLDDARVLFMFRPASPVHYDYKDIAGQKTMLHKRFTGSAPTVDAWLDELERASAFYLDAITQRRLTSWSRGRVTLVASEDSAAESSRFGISGAVSPKPFSPTNVSYTSSRRSSLGA